MPALSNVQFPFPVADCLDVVFIVVDELVPRRRTRVVFDHERRYVHSVDRPVRPNLRPGQGSQCRKQVHRGCQVVANHPGGHFRRPAHYARHPLAALPSGPLFAPQRAIAPALVIQPGTVVARENDQRVIVQPLSFKFGQNYTGCPVDPRDTRPVIPVFRLVYESDRGVQGQMNVHVGKVEEERT